MRMVYYYGDGATVAIMSVQEKRRTSEGSDLISIV